MRRDWEAESRSFDRVAEDYHRFRPSYPEALINDLVSTTGLPPGGRILEVGAGTGKATQLLAQRGFRLHCLEPGENLAAVLRENCQDYPVTIETVRFEEWEVQARAFDLVVSAQAFHWVPKPLGYELAARALKPGGSLALFWNRYPYPQGDVFEAIQAAYDTQAPHMSISKEKMDKLIAEVVEGIAASGCFGPVAVRRYPWSRACTTAEYLGLLNTYSDHLSLPEEQFVRLRAAVGAAIDAHGGVIEVPYLGVLFVARVGAGS